MPVTSIAHNNKHKKILLIVSIVFFATMLFAFCFTAYIVSQHTQLKIDITVFAWLQSKRSSSMTHFMLAITFFGSRYFLFPCYTVLVVYYVFIRKKMWFAVALALTGFLGNELLYLMQGVFKRVRPSDQLINQVTGYGYPSGHSFASFVFAGLMCFIIWQKHLQTKWKLIAAIVLLVCASAIALSRPYLRVHYPTDVLGGFYLSILWLIPCLWILYFVDKKYT